MDGLNDDNQSPMRSTLVVLACNEGVLVCVDRYRDGDK